MARKLTTQENLESQPAGSAEELLSSIGAFNPVKTALDIAGMNPLNPPELNPEQDFGIPIYLRGAGRDRIFNSPIRNEIAADPQLRAMTPFMTRVEYDQLPKTDRGRLKAMRSAVDFETGAGQRQYISPRHDVIMTPEHMVNMALAGASKVGWYEASSAAIQEVFGRDDGARFAALLSATSPQTSVEANFLNTANTWANWVAAGRPQGYDEIMAIMAKSVQGGGTLASVLPAWRNNSVTALTTPDPFEIQLSGPKVQSFMKNLQGDVYYDYYDYSTNDTWQGRLMNLLQDSFKGKGGVADAGYLAINKNMRMATEMLRQQTGYDWTVANVQEATWNYLKTLIDYKRSAASGDKSVVDLVNEDVITGDMIANSVDFATLVQTPEFADPLIRAGILDRMPDGTVGKPTPQGVQPLITRSFGQSGMPAPDKQKLMEYAVVADDIERANEDTDAVLFGYETAPYAGSGHMGGLLEDAEAAAAYHDDPRSDFIPKNEKKDALVAGLAPTKKFAMRQGQGVWTPEGGETEYNKLHVPKLLKPFSKDDKTAERKAAAKNYDTLSAFRAGMGVQGATAWSYPTPQRNAEYEDDAVTIYYPKTLMPQQLAALEARYPDSVLQDTGTSLNIYPYAPGDKAGLKSVRKASGDQAYLEKLLGTGTRIRPTVIYDADAREQLRKKNEKIREKNKKRKDGVVTKQTRFKEAPKAGYFSLEEEWQTPNEGRVTRRLLEQAGEATPQYRKYLDKSPRVRKAVKDLYQLDEEMGTKGYNVRPDVQLMRRRFYEGGLEGLQKALDAGEPLANLSAMERFRRAV